jgi:hypothetical protein
MIFVGYEATILLGIMEIKQPKLGANEYLGM